METLQTFTFQGFSLVMIRGFVQFRDYRELVYQRLWANQTNIFYYTAKFGLDNKAYTIEETIRDSVDQFMYPPHASHMGKW